MVTRNLVCIHTSDEIANVIRNYNITNFSRTDGIPHFEGGTSKMFTGLYPADGVPFVNINEMELGKPYLYRVRATLAANAAGTGKKTQVGMLLYNGTNPPDDCFGAMLSSGYWDTYGVYQNSAYLLVGNFTVGTNPAGYQAWLFEATQCRKSITWPFSGSGTFKNLVLEAIFVKGSSYVDIIFRYSIDGSQVFSAGWVVSYTLEDWETIFGLETTYKMVFGCLHERITSSSYSSLFEISVMEAF